MNLKRKAQRNVGSPKKEIWENPAIDLKMLIDNAPDGRKLMVLPEDFLRKLDSHPIQKG